jgi:hypothetical protein
MQVVRLYTGDDGESHFEELELSYDQVVSGERATVLQAATGVQFRNTPAGDFSDWHTAGRRQYVITLEGQVEIGLGDGTKRVFGPGEVVLVEDLTGRGHTSRVVGGTPRVAVDIKLAD